jgi:glutamate/tyrosine decarboxylase-like PLP-dependent enzyme
VEAELRDRLADLWRRGVEAFGTRERRVIDFASPEALYEIFERSLPLTMTREQGAASLEQLEAALASVVQHSIHSDHPRFFNQNFAGADPVALAGDAFGALLNTTNATFEAAPVFTLMERELTARMAELAGYGRGPQGRREPAGIFCPGGSTANLYAMQLARHRADPGLIDEGADPQKRLVAFTSAHAHYSIDKSVRRLGLGRRSLRKVPCDETGAMRMDALEKELAASVDAGETPFFINASAGTTVTAAFDDYQTINELAAEHGAWVHIDGAVGGAALFSERERHRFAGSAQTSSMTWNLHKQSGATQQCSILLVREPERLRKVFSTKADYLFQADKNYLELDSGDLTFQCARRNDALKGWLMWKARGEAGLAARIEHAVDVATRLEAWVNEREDFVLALPRTFTNVCFWWLPPDMRGAFDPAAITEAQHERLHALAPKMKNLMQREGEAMVGYQPISGGPNAWRMLFINPAVTWDDVEYTMELISKYGRELEG